MSASDNVDYVAKNQGNNIFSCKEDDNEFSMATIVKNKATDDVSIIQAS